MTEVHGKCTKQLAQNAIKNAKFLLSPAVTARYTAGIVFQSAREKDVRRELPRLRDESIKPLRETDSVSVVIQKILGSLS